MEISVNNKVLALLDYPDLMAEQIASGGIHDIGRFNAIQEHLSNNVSTDEITPGWSCFWYDETISEHVYCGFRNKIESQQIKGINAGVIVAGASKGCGSSREHAPFAEKCAGARIILARSFEKIYYQNCINIGLIPTTNFAILEYVFNGKPIPFDMLVQDISEVDKEILLVGGLLNFSKKYLNQPGKNHQKRITAGLKPQNIIEKIIAKNSDVKKQVKQDEPFFCSVDLRFSHEYVTPMTYSIFKGAYGSDAEINDPQSVYCFQDHLTLLHHVHKDESSALRMKAAGLVYEQKRFIKQHQIKHYGPDADAIENAICHNAVLNDLALPGQLIIGTDSHTCTAGAVGALSFGVGATDMANAWRSKQVKMKSPGVINIRLSNSLHDWVTAKDVVLHLLSLPLVQNRETLDNILVYSGDGCGSLNMDERATLTNMAVEAGATTAIFEPDSVTYEFLRSHRNNLKFDDKDYDWLRSDPGADFSQVLDIDLSSIEPMLALPNDPRNAFPISQAIADDYESFQINRAYGGSCTGGKSSDMDMYARVVRKALELGFKLNTQRPFYIQFGSDSVRRYCEEKAYIGLFESAGVKLLDSSCGACIKAGPGISESKDEITISAQNRNFPGRSGPGDLYLASPYVVAASAFAGKITTPKQLFEN